MDRLNSHHKKSIVSALSTILISLSTGIFPSGDKSWDSSIDTLYTVVSAIIAALYVILPSVAIFSFVKGLINGPTTGRWNKVLILIFY